MSIQSISKEEFDKHGVSRDMPADNPMSREIEWYADDASDALGVIRKDKNDDDYAISVLRKENGEYEQDFQSMEIGISSLSDARVRLRQEM